MFHLRVSFPAPENDAYHSSSEVIEAVLLLAERLTSARAFLQTLESRGKFGIIIYESEFSSLDRVSEMTLLFQIEYSQASELSSVWIRI